MAYALSPTHVIPTSKLKIQLPLQFLRVMQLCVETLHSQEILVTIEYSIRRTSKCGHFWDQAKVSSVYRGVHLSSKCGHLRNRPKCPYIGGLHISILQ